MAIKKTEKKNTEEKLYSEAEIKKIVASEIKKALPGIVKKLITNILADKDTGLWSEEAWVWAEEVKLEEGNPGRLSNSLLTREDVLYMLYRYNNI